MLDKHAFELINAGLDRELESAGSGELDSLLESSDEARAARAELLKLTNILDSQPQLLPPSELSQSILEQIKLPRGGKSFSFQGLFSSFQPAIAGAAFAAGVLLSVMVYEMSPRHASDGDLSSMVGSMVAGRNESSFGQVDALAIEQSGLNGSVTLRESQGVVMLDFDMESTQQIEIKLGLAEAGLAFAGIVQAAGLPENVNESYEVSGGTLSVVNQGRQTFTVFLREGTSVKPSKEISIEFSSDGEPVFHGILKG
jgi:hypothetical protein